MIFKSGKSYPSSEYAGLTSEGFVINNPQLDTQAQNSFSLCGYMVSLFAFVLSLLKKRVRLYPESITPKKAA